jgi:hypothetical protein
MSFKVPPRVVHLANEVNKHLLAAREAESQIMEWLNLQGYESNSSDVFGMLCNAETNGEQFAKMLEDAIDNNELEPYSDVKGY